MWTRDGGVAHMLQMFQIQQTSDLPPEKCKSKSLSHRKREKWTISAQASGSLSQQHVRQSGKVCGAPLTFCCMFCYMFLVFLSVNVCESSELGISVLKIKYVHVCKSVEPLKEQFLH